MRAFWMFVIGSLFFNPGFAGNKLSCRGHFVNPITDICWHCMFPITIGSVPVVSGGIPDTSNPSSPIQICPAPLPLGFRVGLAIGYWEPDTIVDVTRVPFCMVNMGGISLDPPGDYYGTGGKESVGSGATGAFYHVHWYRYPLMMWLNILTDLGCMESGDFDIGYLSELDPTWNDDESAFLINPESALFGNTVVQLSCAADAIMTSAPNPGKLPPNPMFWCMGAQGGAYPLTGHVFDQSSPLQASVLLVEKMDFKLHREGLIWDSIGVNGGVCHNYPNPILNKTRFRYQMVNQVPDVLSCHPFGQTTLSWEYAHNIPGMNAENWGYLVWKKRNCVFL